MNVEVKNSFAHVIWAQTCGTEVCIISSIKPQTQAALLYNKQGNIQWP